MHFQSNTERTMSVMALVSSNPHGNIIRIRAALAYRRTRDVRFVVPWLGIDIRSTRRIDFDLDVGAGHTIDFAGEVPPELARRIATAASNGTGALGLIQLEPEEAERLARALVGATPNGADPGIPIIDAYSPHNGVLVPTDIVRKRLIVGEPTP